ncbi:hypothetical protein C4561_01460 [candidate division WWE3 bacterium]|uniref:Uncharacterized protein n=1 Tax=candidate division WWE3 bacterium TaxID=2053526 RepID=A0A3A4ZM25_UNCKA|nr:MAG: hypothetical protein C4561_01460 [candidate division WWE3 bacterium]
MPWSKNKDLPDSVKVLPAGAQTVFRNAANSHFDSHPADETGAMQVGWGAVKNAGYKKMDDGKWAKTEKTESEGILKVEKIGDFYALHLKQEDDFQANSFDEIVLESSNGIKAVVGKLKGTSTVVTKTVLVPASDDWDETAAVEWVTNYYLKKKKKESDGFEYDVESSTLLHESLGMPISEMQVDELTRTVNVNLIKTGWSINGNYWQKKHLDQIAEAINLHQRKKSFVGHSESKLGRSVTKEWMAMLSDPLVEKTSDGQFVLRAKAHVFEFPDEAKALWERIVKYPEAVGMSVDAFVTGKRGEAEGRKGFIPEDVTKFMSADFVDYASAGGGVRVGESIGKIFVSENEEENMNLFEGVLMQMKALKDAERQLWDLNYAFEDYCNQTIRNKDLTPDEKKVKIEAAVADLAVELKKIKFPVIEPGGGTKSAEAKESIHVKEEVITMEVKTVAELITAFPQLTEALKAKAIEDFKAEQKLTENSKQVDALFKENEDLKKANTELDAKLKALEAVTAEDKRKLETFESEKKLAEKATKIDKLLEDSKIVKEAITDEFKKSLFKVEEGEKFETEINALIADRVGVWNRAKGVKSTTGFGEKNLQDASHKQESQGSKLDEQFNKQFPTLAKK